MSCRWATSEHSCSTSAVRGERLRVEIDGVVTSAILSPSWARALRDISPAEVRTIRTWLGRCWRKSSHRNLLSGLGPAASPSSCCIRRKSCDSFLSQSSSAMKSCWRWHCFEAAVHWISWALRTLYGSTSGGARIEEAPNLSRKF